MATFATGTFPVTQQYGVQQYQQQEDPYVHMNKGRDPNLGQNQQVSMRELEPGGAEYGAQGDLDEGVGCAVVSSTSAQDQEAGGQGAAMRGCAVRQHDNIGSIITMLIADQSVDLEDILTDSGINRQEEMVAQGQHAMQQEQSTIIKQETEGLGLDYTGYSPDYSLYQRDYVVTDPEAGVETGRSRLLPRSLSSLSSCSEGDEDGQGYRATAGGYSGHNPTHQQYRGQAQPVSSPGGSKLGEKKDEKYWERRRKNNLAAKKSRDARRVRENQLRLRVLCLENANRVLREQVDRKHLDSVQLRERLSKYESVEEISCQDNAATQAAMRHGMEGCKE